jgi:hypothetical protein
VVEVASERREKAVDVVLGDVVVKRDDLFLQQVPVDNLIALAIIGVVEDIRTPSAILTVGFPAHAVEP